MIKTIVAILSILLVLLLIDIPEAEAYGRGYYDYGGADAYCRYEVNCRCGCPREEYYRRPHRYDYPSSRRYMPYRDCYYDRLPGYCYRYRLWHDQCLRSMPRHRRGGLGPHWGRHREFGRHHRSYRSYRYRQGPCR